MAKTLLDFITGCVTQTEARRFYRAMAAPPVQDQGGPSPQPDQTQQLIDGIRNIYKEPNSPLGQLYKKLFQKDPLDLTPTELTRLTQVVRDRQEDMDVKIELAPEFFNNGKIPQKERIARVIADYFQMNREHFDKAKDLQYDPDRYLLSIHTRKRLVSGFLKKLDMKSEIIRKIEKGLPLPGVTHYRTFRIPLNDQIILPEKQGKVTTQELTGLTARMNQFLAAHKGGEVTLQNGSSPKDAALVFSGSLDILKKLFTAATDEKKFPPLFFRAGQPEEFINELNKQNPKGKGI